MNKKEFIIAISCFTFGFLLVIGLLAFSGCQTPPMPPIDVTFWSGDSSQSGITRSQENVTIQCNNPKFDEYVCLTYSDIQRIYDTMLECKQWPQLASKKQIKQLAKHNAEVIEHVVYKQQNQGHEPIYH